MEHTPIFYLVSRLLKQAKYLIEAKEIQLQLNSHPYFPNIISITDLFDHVKIENLAVRLPRSSEALAQLPSFFLAQVIQEGNENLVLVEKKQESYLLSFHQKWSTELTEEAFLHIWNGLAIVIEDNAHQPKNVLPRMSRIALLGCASLIGVGIWGVIYDFSLTGMLYSVLTMLGWLISISLLQLEFGSSNAFVNKVCAGGPNIDCEAVISSKGASLIQGLKLSHLSMWYFSGILLFQLINGSLLSPVLLLLSLLSVPLIIFSLYYQAFVAKQWCTLCSLILLLLLAQLPLTILQEEIEFSSFDFLSAGNLGLAFLISATLLTFVLQLLEDNHSLSDISVKYLKFKREFAIFSTQLRKKDPLNTPWISEEEIVFGDPSADAPISLLIITNPLCHYCKAVDRNMNQLLQRVGKQIQVRIRFNVDPAQADHPSVQISHRLLALFHQQGEEICRQAMHDIYGEMDAKTWLATWNSLPSEDYSHVLQAQLDWCNRENIYFTPLVLLNGHPYPSEYEIQDLEYFIEELLEEQSKLPAAVDSEKLRA
ncbi:MAG: vitamin K epoxide reductase family protein [Bacteroidota bacterium]